MDLSIENEILLEGIARGAHRALTEAGVPKRFMELLSLLEGLHTLKEGLLTADQASTLLQLARRTFDRKVAEKDFRKEEALGHNEPRFWLKDILEVLNLGHLKAVADPTGDGMAGLNLIDLAGTLAAGGGGQQRRRRRAKAA